MRTATGGRNGLQDLFDRPVNNPIVVPDWLSQICNDPEQLYNIPVCCLQDSYGLTPDIHFMLSYCRLSLQLNLQQSLEICLLTG